MNLADAKPGLAVVKPGYHYYGTIIGTERKYKTDWVVVLWRGTIYTVQEYPHTIELSPEPPEIIRNYN